MPSPSLSITRDSNSHMTPKNTRTLLLSQLSPLVILMAILSDERIHQNDFQYDCLNTDGSYSSTAVMISYRKPDYSTNKLTRIQNTKM